MVKIPDTRAFIRRAAPAVLAFAALGLAAAPARAQTAPVVTGAAQSVSSATWTWPLSADATGYRVLSTTSPGTNISGDFPAAAANSFSLTGFSTETLVGVVVEAFGPGFAVDAPTSTVLTLAATP
jgi:hypothetical protein